MNGYKTLGTPDRVVKGKVIPGRPPRNASKKTRTHLKWITHLMFECAIKWGRLPLQRNPVLLVNVKGKAGRKVVEMLRKRA